GAVEEHSDLLAAVGLADPRQQRLVIDGTRPLPRDQDTVSGFHVDRPVDGALRILPGDRHLGRLPAQEPARPQRREEEEVGLVLEQLITPARKIITSPSRRHTGYKGVGSSSSHGPATGPTCA